MHLLWSRLYAYAVFTQGYMEEISKIWPGQRHELEDRVKPSYRHLLPVH